MVLGHDGQARFERGFIRAEDQAPPADEGDEAPPDGVSPGTAEPTDGEAEAPSGATLSERLVANLTAHRTQALRDTLAAQPALALRAVAHALALQVFYPGERASCLELKTVSAWLGGHAPGIEDGPAGRAHARRCTTSRPR